MKQKQVLAFDYGASGGRAVLGRFDGARIRLEEVHRFPNDPVLFHGTLYWDVLRLFHEMKQGMLAAKQAGGFDCVGVDTWGVDFGLLAADGGLLENPIHYRDGRTEGVLAESVLCIPEDEFYQITGNQFMEINTAFQLRSLITKRPQLLEHADTMLLMPDLFVYFLTGRKEAEYSIASTTQLMDAGAKEWSQRVIEALSIPRRLFPSIVFPGNMAGKLCPALCRELGISAADVAVVTGHDTQCAMTAVPANEEDFVFISSGTWSLLGTELRAPLISEKSRCYNITNEGGFGGKAAFLSNIVGLWLVQECRRQWIREGKMVSFRELEAMAREAKPFSCFINPDHALFAPEGDMPGRIRKYAAATDQHVPCTKGEIVRCINESLAFQYRQALERIRDCTGKTYPVIYMVGGGTKSRQLCQFTANATGCVVSAGPAEASALGNVLQQLIAAGEIKDLAQARRLTATSPDITRYEPEMASGWNKAYERYREVIQ